MISSTVPVPDVEAAATLGALLGPVAALAIVAVFVALAVLLWGLASEAQEQVATRPQQPLLRKPIALRPAA